MTSEKIISGDTVAIEKRLGYLWVTLPESVTLYNFALIEREIFQHLSGVDDHVAFDLTRLRAVYSSSLGILIRVRKRVGEGGGVVCLVNVSRRITDMLASFNLNKVFPIYYTDVEFEVFQEEIWKQRLSQKDVAFLFIPQIENGVYRIALSGEMIIENDLTNARSFQPNESVKKYVFDMTGLHGMDSNGAGIFMGLLDRICQMHGKCRAFGINKNIKQLLSFIDAERYLVPYDDALAALKDIT